MAKHKQIKFLMKLTGGKIPSKFWIKYTTDSALCSIAAVPPFRGLRRFHQGRKFKQWTGNDSKALMKVRLRFLFDSIMSLSSIKSRCFFQLLRASYHPGYCGHFALFKNFATLFGMTLLLKKCSMTYKMRWPGFMPTGLFLRHLVFVLMALHFQGNIQWSIISQWSGVLVHLMVFVHPSLSQSIESPSKNLGDAHAATML